MSKVVPPESTDVCAICMDELSLIAGKSILFCGTCKKGLHGSCAMKLRDVNCPSCRAPIFDEAPRANPPTARLIGTNIGGLIGSPQNIEGDLNDIASILQQMTGAMQNAVNSVGNANNMNTNAENQGQDNNGGGELNATLNFDTDLNFGPAYDPERLLNDAFDYQERTNSNFEETRLFLQGSMIGVPQDVQNQLVDMLRAFASDNEPENENGDNVQSDTPEVTFATSPITSLEEGILVRTFNQGACSPPENDHGDNVQPGLPQLVTIATRQEIDTPNFGPRSTPGVESGPRAIHVTTREVSADDFYGAAFYGDTSIPPSMQVSDSDGDAPANAEQPRNQLTERDVQQSAGQGRASAQDGATAVQVNSSTDESVRQYLSEMEVIQASPTGVAIGQAGAVQIARSNPAVSEPARTVSDISSDDSWINTMD